MHLSKKKKKIQLSFILSWLFKTTQYSTKNRNTRETVVCVSSTPDHSFRVHQIPHSLRLSFHLNRPIISGTVWSSASWKEGVFGCVFSGTWKFRVSRQISRAFPRPSPTKRGFVIYFPFSLFLLFLPKVAFPLSFYLGIKSHSPIL